MAIPSRQIGGSTRTALLWQISKQLEQLICVRAGGCNTTTTTTSTLPPTQLRMLFTDINNIVSEPNDLNDWNTFFQLPLNGNPFTSLTLIDNEIFIWRK